MLNIQLDIYIYHHEGKMSSSNDVADVLFPVSSIRPMFSKCNNIMNNGGHGNNADATLFGSEFLDDKSGKYWSDEQVSNVVCKAHFLSVVSNSSTAFLWQLD